MIVYGDPKRRLLRRDVQAANDRIVLGQFVQAVSDARGEHAFEFDDLLLGRTTSWPDAPEVVEATEPEGYAFYAVDPRLYELAAEQVRGLAKAWTVIGIRSIGTSLGATVARVLPNARIVTVRPTGHPFERALQPSDGEARVMRDGREGHYAVVDEGPGLSGSSFLSVARWLEGEGVDRERIVFFPSHDGEPGAMCTDRALWFAIRKAHVPFETLHPFDRHRDLSAGRWRALNGVTCGANVQQEKRKYLSRDGVLAKFAGYGLRGGEMLAYATELADAGFAPPVLQLQDGFLFTRWISANGAPDIPRYLAFRNRWPAPRRGATAQQLLDMACYNLGEHLRHLQPLVPEIDDRAVPVVTDNRLHAWEWCGALKTDALDHHASHDLIGCQDLAWDLAGAIVELPIDRAALVDSVQKLTRRHWPLHVLEFYETCYRAFWYGYYTLASRACPVEEAPRLFAEAARYVT